MLTMYAPERHTLGVMVWQISSTASTGPIPLRRRFSLPPSRIRFLKVPPCEQLPFPSVAVILMHTLLPHNLREEQ